MAEATPPPRRVREEAVFFAYMLEVACFQIMAAAHAAVEDEQDEERSADMVVLIS